MWRLGCQGCGRTSTKSSIPSQIPTNFRIPISYSSEIGFDSPILVTLLDLAQSLQMQALEGGLGLIAPGDETGREWMRSTTKPMQICIGFLFILCGFLKWKINGTVTNDSIFSPGELREKEKCWLWLHRYVMWTCFRSHSILFASSTEEPLWQCDFEIYAQLWSISCCLHAHSCGLLTSVWFLPSPLKQL